MKEQNELDFDNYSVEAERALLIRQSVASLKNSTWVKDFKYLVQELGTLEQDSRIEAGLFGNSEKGQELKVFQLNLASSEQEIVDFKISMGETELRVFYDQNLLLEVSLLPKEDEYLVYSFNGELWARFEQSGKEQLAQMIKAAHSAKQKKQEAFKAKFSK